MAGVLIPADEPDWVDALMRAASKLADRILRAPEGSDERLAVFAEAEARDLAGAVAWELQQRLERMRAVNAAIDRLGPKARREIKAAFLLGTNPHWRRVIVAEPGDELAIGVGFRLVVRDKPRYGYFELQLPADDAARYALGLFEHLDELVAAHADESAMLPAVREGGSAPSEGYPQ